MLKSQITRRKFYGKWLYRVGVKCPGISIIRNLSLKETVAALSTLDSTSIRYKTVFILPKTRANAEDIIKVCNFLSTLDEQSWSKRVETNHVDIYTNDADVYAQCQKNLKSWIVAISEPDLNSLTIIESSDRVAVTKYPHDRYQYKVFLKPHKLKGDRDSKIKFLDWLDGQDKILISDTVKTWFLTTDWNWDRRYLLVEDPNTLLMLKMRGAEICGKVHEYVIVDK